MTIPESPVSVVTDAIGVVEIVGEPDIVVGIAESEAFSVKLELQ
jgi:hypothetical protein